jgi:hypothetical protein
MAFFALPPYALAVPYAVFVGLLLFYFRDPLRRNWSQVVRFSLFGILRTVVIAALFVGLMVSDAGWLTITLAAAGAWVLLAALWRAERGLYVRPTSPRATRMTALGEAAAVAALAILATTPATRGGTSRCS